MRKTFVIDLDHTLCDTIKDSNGRWMYFDAQPYYDRIDRVNELWEAGN